MRSHLFVYCAHMFYRISGACIYILTILKWHDWALGLLRSPIMHIPCSLDCWNQLFTEDSSCTGDHSFHEKGTIILETCIPLRGPGRDVWMSSPLADYCTPCIVETKGERGTQYGSVTQTTWNTDTMTWNTDQDPESGKLIEAFIDAVHREDSICIVCCNLRS